MLISDWSADGCSSDLGSSRETQKMRLCDRHGCTNPGNCPAPKSPNSPERWYFCEAHAAEYNRGWDYFEGLSTDDAAERAADEARGANSYAPAQHYAWGGTGAGSPEEPRFGPRCFGTV